MFLTNNRIKTKVILSEIRSLKFLTFLSEKDSILYKREFKVEEINEHIKIAERKIEEMSIMFYELETKAKIREYENIIKEMKVFVKDIIKLKEKYPNTFFAKKHEYIMFNGFINLYKNIR